MGGGVLLASQSQGQCRWRCSKRVGGSGMNRPVELMAEQQGGIPCLAKPHMPQSCLPGCCARSSCRPRPPSRALLPTAPGAQGTTGPALRLTPRRAVQVAEQVHLVAHRGHVVLNVLPVRRNQVVLSSHQRTQHVSICAARAGAETVEDEVRGPMCAWCVSASPPAAMPARTSTCKTRTAWSSECTMHEQNSAAARIRNTWPRSSAAAHGIASHSPLPSTPQ